MSKLTPAQQNKRLLRQVLKPGTFWTRINHRFTQRYDTQTYPAGTPFLTQVLKLDPDAIVLEIGTPSPRRFVSFLAYPTSPGLRAELHEGGVRIWDKDRVLLTYLPTDERFKDIQPQAHD